MKYSIGEFSRLTGFGIHTLRYYEHEGLIIPERSSANRRCYSENDITWIAFIKRLKDTGMPIREIRRYAELRTAGDATLEERFNILIRHGEMLNRQILNLRENQEKLNEKIDFYRSEIARVNGQSNGVT